jgi:cobalt-zinc-cadmium efflux system outer membrane protein
MILALFSARLRHSTTMPKFFPLAVLGLASMALQLHAQPAVVVSLASVGARIHTQNPDLAAARLSVREAAGRLRQSGRLANPDLESSVERHPDSREGKVEIGLSQRFPVTSRLRLEREVSLVEFKSSEAEVREVERQLIGQARETLVKVMAARERRELLREQSAVATRFAEFLSEVAAKGEGSPLDASQAKLEAATHAMEMRQLSASEMALIGELKPLLGMGPEDALHIDGTLPEPSLPRSVLDPSVRPDFQVATLAARAAAHGVDLEFSRRYDDVEGGLFAAAERTQDSPEGYKDEAILGLRFKIALPFRNQNEGAIQAAQAKQERKDKEVVALRRKIQLEAAAARAEMKEWAKMIHEINQTLLPLADAQSTLAESTYHKGQGEIQAVLRSHDKRFQFAAARLDAHREFHLARVRYETALAKP